MGENEQGGMLRVVVVVGLVALIAAAVIMIVMDLKKKMQDTSTAVQSNIDSGIAAK